MYLPAFFTPLVELRATLAPLLPECSSSTYIPAKCYFCLHAFCCRYLLFHCDSLIDIHVYYRRVFILIRGAVSRASDISKIRQIDFMSRTWK